MPDTSGLPDSGLLGVLTLSQRKQLSAWIRAEVKLAISTEMAPAYKELGKQLDKVSHKVDAQSLKGDTLQKSVEDWISHAKAVEESSRLYEKQIYEHVASVDQKVAASEPLRKTALGTWDVLLELVVPMRKLCQRIVKACLHFESLGPSPRRDSTGKESLAKPKRVERWRDR